MNEAEEKRIADRLKAFIKSRKGVSQNTVAETLGISRTLLSQFLNGRYKGNTKDVVNKIVNFLDTISRMDRRVKGKAFVETSIAKRIGTLITQTEAFSDDEGKIGVIVGDGGHGKSHCLRQYAEANKNTVYVELDDAMNSTTVFAEIAKKLGIDSDGSLDKVTRRLIDALQNRQIIVMLDEASGLTVRQLNRLRQIIVVKSRCPLVLAGNHDLLKTIMQPTTRRGFESLDQFTSRLMCILNLDEHAAEKDGGLYTVEDIRRLYEYGGVKLTIDAVGTLRNICRTPRSGRLRTCSHVIAALHTAGVVYETGAIDSALIIAAIEQLDLPVRVRLPLATRHIAEHKEQQAVARTG